jgi:hypothetical protein
MTIMHEHVHCIAACRLAGYDDIQMCHARFARVTKSPIFKLSARLPALARGTMRAPGPRLSARATS